MPCRSASLGQNSQMLGHSTRPHSEQKHVAGLFLTRINRLQELPRRLQQLFAALRFGPVGRIGRDQPRLIAMHLAPKPAQKAQAIGASPLATGLM